jgi:hypothetical protein
VNLAIVKVWDSKNGGGNTGLFGGEIWRFAAAGCGRGYASNLVWGFFWAGFLCVW